LLTERPQNRRQPGRIFRSNARIVHPTAAFAFSAHGPRSLPENLSVRPSHELASSARASVKRPPKPRVKAIARSNPQEAETSSQLHARILRASFFLFEPHSTSPEAQATLFTAASSAAFSTNFRAPSQVVEILSADIPFAATPLQTLPRSASAQADTTSSRPGLPSHQLQTENPPTDRLAIHLSQASRGQTEARSGE